jgi:transposase
VAGAAEDIEALRAENAAQRAQIAALIEQVARLSERIAELLAVAQRKSRKPPGSAPAATAPVALDGPAKQAFDERPAPPALPSKPPKPPRQAKPTGRKPLPAHLPAEEHALRPDACAHCGSDALDEADIVVEEKLHVVKEHQRRRVVRRTTCRCRRCGARTTPASLPAPYARSKVTSEWLAWFIHQKFGLLTPLDRVRRDLADRGVPLAMGTLVGFVERAADLLAPVDGVHWKQLLAGSWMATDGTGLKVLVPGLPAAHDGYLELYRDERCAVFQYAATKAADEVVAKLAAFRGTLTADAEHRFNAVYATGRVVEAGCNAHGRRKFRDAESTQPALAAEGGAFIAAMYVAEQEARGLGLVEDALLAHRRARIRPIVDDFAKWLAAVEPSLLPSDPLRTAVAYYKNHWVALTRFVNDAQVPIDNSPTEREFQNVAKLRLNMLFAGSTEGAHRACVLLGIVATCRAVGVPVQAYLAWAFDRLGTHRADYGLAADQLTPAAFKRLHG